jgi:hypothetical protein
MADPDKQSPVTIQGTSCVNARTGRRAGKTAHREKHYYASPVLEKDFRGAAVYQRMLNPTVQ